MMNIFTNVFDILHVSRMAQIQIPKNDCNKKVYHFRFIFKKLIHYFTESYPPPSNTEGVLFLVSDSF